MNRDREDTNSMQEQELERQRPDRTAVFERYRARLFGIAYRMLGSVEDAQDMIQETYLRWHQADAVTVRSPEAWLITVATRLSIDRLRRTSLEREGYVGDWLPEPIATDEPSSPDQRAELASDLSMAFLLLLERLSPEERAAFLLREVMDADYGEIARVLKKSEAACRQIVHRARARVREDRARFAVAPETKERLVEQFLTAVQTQNQEAILALVAEDATWTSDSGGRVSAARKVIHGAVHIAHFVLGLEQKWGDLARHEVAWINGEATTLTYVGAQLISTTSIVTDGERVIAFYRVLNPDKLRHAAGGDNPELRLL